MLHKKAAADPKRLVPIHENRVSARIIICDYNNRSHNYLTVSLSKKRLSRITYYLLTNSEVFTGKSQIETLPFLPRDNEVNTAKPRFEIFP